MMTSDSVSHLSSHLLRHTLCLLRVIMNTFSAPPSNLVPKLVIGVVGMKKNILREDRWIRGVAWPGVLGRIISLHLEVCDVVAWVEVKEDTKWNSVIR